MEWEYTQMKSIVMVRGGWKAKERRKDIGKKR
jgi:hypothetical protein